MWLDGDSDWEGEWKELKEDNKSGKKRKKRRRWRWKATVTTNKQRKKRKNETVEKQRKITKRNTQKMTYKIHVSLLTASLVSRETYIHTETHPGKQLSYKRSSPLSSRHASPDTRIHEKTRLPYLVRKNSLACEVTQMKSAKPVPDVWWERKRFRFPLPGEN